MLRKINNDESGVVLVTSLLFLMIVTFLAIAGIQNPKADIEISNNDRYLTQSQQLSNLAAMEAKNWLLTHYSDKSKIRNQFTGGTLYVTSQSTNLDVGVNTDFNKAGIMPCYPDAANCTKLGVGVKPIVQINGTQIGEYSWKIVNTSNDDDDSIVKPQVDSYISTLISNGALITSNYRTKKSEPVKQNVALDKDRLFYHYYHIDSSGYAYSGANSIGVIARSEAMVSYKYVEASQN